MAHLLSKHVADVSQQCHVAIACQLQAVGKGDAGGEVREAMQEKTEKF